MGIYFCAFREGEKISGSGADGFEGERGAGRRKCGRDAVVVVTLALLAVVAGVYEAAALRLATGV